MQRKTSSPQDFLASLLQVVEESGSFPDRQYGNTLVLNAKVTKGLDHKEQRVPGTGVQRLNAKVQRLNAKGANWLNAKVTKGLDHKEQRVPGTGVQSWTSN